MYSIFLTKQFQAELDKLDNSLKGRVAKTVKQIQEDPHHPGLGTHSATIDSNRKVMRSRVNDNFRILWEWLEGGDIALWRVGKHEVIDRIVDLPTANAEKWKLYTRDADDQSLVELESLAASPDLPQPLEHVPPNILRLFGVPDAQLDAVKSLRDVEDIWDLPIPENVQSTLLDLLTNPAWTLDNLLDTGQLLYRTTVDQLEGYCEGNIKQLLLNLNAEQARYVGIQTSGPLLIKGVAGSGKTTIGLYRANHLAAAIENSRRFFGEDTSILLLTYTGTLVNALRQLYTELYGELPQSITVQGYKEWMLQQLRANNIFLNAADEDTRREIVRRAQQDVARVFPQDTVVRGRTADYLLQEIDQVIRARGLASLDEYQAIERIGRGIGLDRARHRPIVWKIYERYQRELDKRSLFDWADLARLVQKHCPELPQYDVVIIDEAQDFQPSEIRLATRLIPDYRELRSLTLLADPAQSIYYRGIPWKEAGINIQGRTRVLAKNFRNTSEILEAARHIVDGCADLQADGEYIPPTGTRRRGPKPIVASYRGAMESNRYLADEILRLCQMGQYRPGDIAVISRGKTLLTKYIQSYLEQQNIHCRFFRDRDFQVLENEVKLITMHSAKGLEFPVVFLVGLDDQYMPYISRDSDTRQEDELQERKLFYVSMTRAAERLYLLHPQRNRSRFLHDLDAATISQRQC